MARSRHGTENSANKVGVFYVQFFARAGGVGAHVSDKYLSHVTILTDSLTPVRCDDYRMMIDDDVVMIIDDDPRNRYYP